MAAVYTLRDCGLKGLDGAAALASALAPAKAHACPVSRKELMQRRDGPAVRDTVLWFVLLLASDAAGIALWGSWRSVIPFAIYGVACAKPFGAGAAE